MSEAPSQLPHQSETELRDQQTAAAEADLDQRIAAMNQHSAETQAKKAATAEELQKEREAVIERVGMQAYGKAYETGLSNSLGDLPVDRAKRGTAEQDGPDLFDATIEDAAEAARDRAKARAKRDFAFQDARHDDNWNATRDILDQAYDASSEASGFETGRGDTEFDRYFESLSQGEKEAYTTYRKARGRAQDLAQGADAYGLHADDEDMVVFRAPSATKDKAAAGDKTGEAPSEAAKAGDAGDEGIKPTGDKPGEAATTTDSKRSDYKPADFDKWREAAKARAAKLKEKQEKGPIHAMGVNKDGDFVDTKGRVVKRLQDRMRSPEQIAQLLGADGEANLARARKERAEMEKTKPRSAFGNWLLGVTPKEPKADKPGLAARIRGFWKPKGDNATADNDPAAAAQAAADDQEQAKTAESPSEKTQSSRRARVGKLLQRVTTPRTGARSQDVDEQLAHVPKLGAPKATTTEESTPERVPETTPDSEVNAGTPQSRRIDAGRARFAEQLAAIDKAREQAAAQPQAEDGEPKTVPYKDEAERLASKLSEEQLKEFGMSREEYAETLRAGGGEAGSDSNG